MGQHGRRFRGFILAAVMVAAMLVLGACGDDDDSGQGGSTGEGSKVTKVRAGFTPGFGTLPVQIAREKGYFKANGLDVQFTEGLDLPAWTAALGKQFEIVMTTPSILLQATSRGAPATVISGMQIIDKQHPNNVLVTNDPNIKSAADLGGKKVGVPTLTGASAEAVRYLVKEAGINLDDVKFVVTPFDTQGDQLKAGRIDAAVSAIPFYTAQEASGLQIRDDVILEAVEKASDGAQDKTTVASFMSTSSYAQDNPDVVEAWRRSLQQGIDFMESNEAEARQILQTWLKLPPQIAKNAPLPGVDVNVTVAELEPFVTMGEATGSLKNAPDVNKLVYQGS